MGREEEGGKLTRGPWRERGRGERQWPRRYWNELHPAKSPEQPRCGRCSTMGTLPSHWRLSSSYWNLADLLGGGSQSPPPSPMPSQINKTQQKSKRKREKGKISLDFLPRATDLLPVELKGSPFFKRIEKTELLSTSVGIAPRCAVFQSLLLLKVLRMILPTHMPTLPDAMGLPDNILMAMSIKSE